MRANSRNTLYISHTSGWAMSAVNFSPVRNRNSAKFLHRTKGIFKCRQNHCLPQCTMCPHTASYPTQSPSSQWAWESEAWQILDTAVFNHSGRTAPLTSKRCISCIYSTNIGTEYFKHGIHSPFFFSSNCSLFHNSSVFGSCIIHILYTGCAKIKKSNSVAKRLIHKIFH